MFRLSQFAAPAMLGAALFLGVQGCASDRKDMPGNAQLLSQGREDTSATAPHDGTVYVYDDTSHKTIYSGRVEKGDNIRVDARDNRVMFNDRPAVKQDLVNDHRYQIYFDRNEAGDAVPARHREGETIIEPRSSGGATIVQPNGARTTVVPPESNTTVIQPPPPSNTTVTPGGTVVQPNGTVVQPNGTVVQPNSSGGATVVTPSR